MNLVKTKSMFLAFIVIFFSLFTYRSIFSGRMLGEPFDARLMISLHEHMWRWLNGLVSFRDTEFFYPYDTALGYSDVFLVQGMIYSIFRFFGFDSLTSWTSVTIILVVIGNLGWILIAKKYLNNFIIQILFVLTMVSSLSFVHYFTFNPNVVGYAFLSWMIILLINVLNEKDNKKFHIKINVFILIFLIYALSCWYAAFFLFLTVLFRSIIKIFTNKFKFRVKSYQSVYRIYLFFAPLNAFFVWLFYYVYISVSNQPGRPISEMITNSPRVQQIFRGANPNGGGMEGSIFVSLYEWLNIDDPIVFNGVVGDWGGGLGIFVPIVGVVIIFVSLIATKTIKDYSWLIAVISVYVYFMVFGDDVSIHSFLFGYIPGLNSIRSPSRYIILVGFTTIFLIFYFLDKFFIRRKNYFINILIFSILSLIFVDQHRYSFKGWDRKDFINPDLMALESEIQKNCDYFYYDKPGGWWFDQIEALSFAVQIGVPTVNGYSGAFPPNYPNRAWNQDSPSIEIFDWMKQIDQDKRGCLILGNSNIRYLNDSVVSIDFYGFTEEESSGNSNWRWAVAPQAHLFVIGNKETKQNLEFELRGAPCFNNQNIQIVSEENDISQSFVMNKNAIPINLDLDFSESAGKSITIRTDSPVCNLEGDPRDLYFEIKNIKLKESSLN